MARIRSVKPDFFKSLSVADLSIPARLTFIGLWTHVDDEGRCEADARLLKAAIWPLDNDMSLMRVDDLIAELADAGKVVRYTVAGREYLEVQGWHHQKIDRRTDSKFPGPDQQDRPLAEDSSSDQRAVAEDSSPDLDLGSGSMDLDRERSRVVAPRSFVEMAEPNGPIALHRDCSAVLQDAERLTADPLLSKERATLRPVIEEALSLGYDPTAVASAVAFAPFRTMAGVMGELRKAKQPSRASVGDDIGKAVGSWMEEP